MLLKNEGALLPLDKTKLKSVALIGRYASEVLLDWYSGTPPYTVTPVNGLKAALGPHVALRYSNGTDSAEAARLAAECDVAVLCVGNHPVADEGWEKTRRPDYGKEAVDRQSLTLPEEDSLIKPVLAANPRTVVVLIASFPYAINWTQENVPAILHMAHNSQEEGRALADVLLGDYNPAGRLTQTWVRSLDDLPPMMDYDIRNGRTYMYFQGEPLYPFGYGLSYTTFRYENLRVRPETVLDGGEIAVDVDIANTGSRDGDEVVQCYAQYLDSAVERPRKQLVSFARIPVAAGQTVTATLRMKASQLAYWSVEQHRFVTEPGKRVRLLIGPSSARAELEFSALGPYRTTFTVLRARGAGVSRVRRPEAGRGRPPRARSWKRSSSYNSAITCGERGLGALGVLSLKTPGKCSRSRLIEN